MDRELASQYYPVREIWDLKSMITTSAELFADRAAFLVKRIKGGDYTEISYRQLKSDVDALGTRLIDMGLKDEKIALIGENCYEWIAAYYAIVCGTGVAVPLDKELTRDEIQNLLKAADCKAILYTNAYKKMVDGFDIPVRINMGGPGYDFDAVTAPELSWKALVMEGEALRAGGDARFTDASVDPEAMSVILFTSGTTGIPKGVMLNHKNIMSDVMDTCRIVNIRPEDRTLSILPIHHTFESTLGIALVLYKGASIAFCEGLKYIAKNLSEAGATVLLGVPLIFESVYDKIWRQAEKQGKDKILKKAIAINRTMKTLGIDLSRKLFKDIHAKLGGKLRLIITGAAAIDPNVCRGFEDFGFKVLQGYGLTECSPLVAGCPEFSNTYKKAGSVGPAVASGEIRIIDQDEDGIGEIIYRGPNVMLGYYNMPEQTADVLKDGWFHTGDLGFLDREGWLYITGRKKNVIVTKTGKNIYPEEVEFYINRNKYIEESLVTGIEEDESEETTVGAQIKPAYEIIYEEFGKDFDDAAVQSLIRKIIADINEKLPIYKRIRNFTVRKEDFEHTTTKKIKRNYKK